MDLWRSVALLSAAVGQTVFVLFYVTFPWWRSALGRGLFYSALISALLLDFAILGRLFNFAGEDHLYAPLYTLLSFGILAQVVLFLLIRRRTLMEEAR